MTFQVVSSLTDQQVSQLVELYQNEFWSKERTHPDVVRMLAGSDVVIGIVDESNTLIAFVRVLTDFVYRATIYDVIVKSTHRQQGLGTQLLDAVFNHPQLKDVENFALFCLSEMFPFYERWGFAANKFNIQLMIR